MGRKQCWRGRAKVRGREAASIIRVSIQPTSSWEHGAQKRGGGGMRTMKWRTQGSGHQEGRLQCRDPGGRGNLGLVCSPAFLLRPALRVPGSKARQEPRGSPSGFPPTFSSREFCPCVETSALVIMGRRERRGCF